MIAKGCETLAVQESQARRDQVSLPRERQTVATEAKVRKVGSEE